MNAVQEQVARQRASAYDEIYARSHAKRVTCDSYERWMRFFLDAPLDAPGHLAGNEIQFALQRLGVDQLDGKRILDLCCGVGRSSVYLALRGARVCGIDASATAIDVARETAQVSGVEERVDFAAMDAQRLAFADAEFDAIYCQSAMHILIDYPDAPRELARTLKPGGKLIFSDEPLGHNPLLEPIRWWRRRRYRGCGGRTIRYRDIRRFGEAFAETRIFHFGLLSQVKTFLGGAAHRAVLRKPLRGLHSLDDWLLARATWLRPLAAKIVVEYVKGEPA